MYRPIDPDVDVVAGAVDDLAADLPVVNKDAMPGFDGGEGLRQRAGEDRRGAGIVDADWARPKAQPDDIAGADTQPVRDIGDADMRASKVHEDAAAARERVACGRKLGFRRADGLDEGVPVPERAVSAVDAGDIYAGEEQAPDLVERVREFVVECDHDSRVAGRARTAEERNAPLGEDALGFDPERMRAVQAGYTQPAKDVLQRTEHVTFEPAERGEAEVREFELKARQVVAAQLDVGEKVRGARPDVVLSGRADRRSSVPGRPVDRFQRLAGGIASHVTSVAPSR